MTSSATEVSIGTNAIAISDSQICAILADQVGALRDRINSAVEIELLWRTVDALSVLSDLLAASAPKQVASAIAGREECDVAIAAAREVAEALEAVALQQSQTQDLARQMAECVQNALQRLAMPMESGPRISTADLASTYVCNEQRAVHAAVDLRYAGLADLNQ